MFVCVCVCVWYLCKYPREASTGGTRKRRDDAYMGFPESFYSCNFRLTETEIILCFPYVLIRSAYSPTVETGAVVPVAMTVLWTPGEESVGQIPNCVGRFIQSIFQGVFLFVCLFCFVLAIPDD